MDALRIPILASMSNLEMRLTNALAVGIAETPTDVGILGRKPVLTNLMRSTHEVACWVPRAVPRVLFSMIHSHTITVLEHSPLCAQVRTAFETDLAEVCAPRQANVGLLAYSPLAGGALSGKYTDKAPEGARFTIFPGLSLDCLCRHVCNSLQQGHMTCC